MSTVDEDFRAYGTDTPRTDTPGTVRHWRTSWRERHDRNYYLNENPTRRRIVLRTVAHPRTIRDSFLTVTHSLNLFLLFICPLGGSSSAPGVDRRDVTGPTRGQCVHGHFPHRASERVEETGHFEPRLSRHFMLWSHYALSLHTHLRVSGLKVVPKIKIPTFLSSSSKVFVQYGS